MRMNKSTGDAIRILVDCARGEGALAKVGELSERLDITMQNVFKIVHMLSRGGLVAPVRGRNGGVRLARPAGEIMIGDVVRAMETTDMAVQATSGGDPAGGVGLVFDAALEAFIAVLDKHSLADMVEREKRPSPARRARATSPSKATVPRGKTSRIAAVGTGRGSRRAGRPSAEKS